MKRVPVSLGERSYAVTVGHGCLGDEAWWRAAIADDVAAVVTDARVAPHWLHVVQAAIESIGVRVVPIVVDAGESHKDWHTLDQIYTQLLRAHCDRQTTIVALGGGVIGDIAGFAAATYLRGVPFVQVPTTLLAQVDSSIGGKTGINHALGKNMVGAFYQPRAVMVDVATLATLPLRELVAGLAEVIKHGLVADVDYLARVEAQLVRLLARDAEALTEIVAGSCAIKAAVVADDEREAGRRAILNFGHTFGHAIEAGLGFGVWLHGEAIGAGMVQGAQLSSALGHIGADDVARVTDLVARCGLPIEAPDLGLARWLELMALDKKSSGGAPRFVVLRQLGDAYVTPVAREPLARVLAKTAVLPLVQARATTAEQAQP